MKASYLSITKKLPKIEGLITEQLREKKTFIFILIFAGLVSLRIWLIHGIPKMYILGPHDDLFFAKAAHYLIKGEWMGPYTQITLIKTPFYAFFLALSSLSGLPLLLTETMYYLVACFILYNSLSPLVRSRAWQLLIFAVVLFIPANLAYLRVYREGVYFSTTLYVVAFAIGFFLRLDWKVSELLVWSIGLGLSMGVFMMTREEGIWIYPILFLFLFVCIWWIWTRKEGDKNKRLALVVLPIILWYIPSTIVSYINFSYYGFWGTSEQLEPEFRRVIDTLGRIKSDDWHPLISISEDARSKAHEASPLFNQLGDSFEEYQGLWNSSENSMITSKPAWLLEYYGNGKSALSNDYFVWMIRDVVYNEGYYSEGKYPKEFYTRLADELEAACDNGDLACLPSQKIPLIGSIDIEHFPIIRRMFFENVLHLVYQDIYSISSLNVKSWPMYLHNSDDYKYFEEIAHNPLAELEMSYDYEEGEHLSDGSITSWLNMLERKEKAMSIIYAIYKTISPLIIMTGIVVWIYLMKSINHMKSHLQWVIVSFFLLGLFLTRLATLTIVDATTGAPGIYYGSSIYIFLYGFSLLMLIWAIKNWVANRRLQLTNNR